MKSNKLLAALIATGALFSANLAGAQTISDTRTGYVTGVETVWTQRVIHEPVTKTSCHTTRSHAGVQGNVDDGAYAGFYKVTFANPDTGEKKGNTGEFIFIIEDNKIVDVQYSDDDFVKGKTKFKLKIDEKTGKLKGYFTERGRRHEGNIINLRWQMKGVFVDQFFAGEAIIYLTQWNGQTPEAGMIKLASYVFESP